MASAVDACVDLCTNAIKKRCTSEKKTDESLDQLIAMVAQARDALAAGADGPEAGALVAQLAKRAEGPLKDFTAHTKDFHSAISKLSKASCAAGRWRGRVLHAHAHVYQCHAGPHAHEGPHPHCGAGPPQPTPRPPPCSHEGPQPNPISPPPTTPMPPPRLARRHGAPPTPHCCMRRCWTGRVT
jgi:hypothetical protein